MNDVLLILDILHTAMDLERDVCASASHGAVKESMCTRARDLVDRLTDLHDALMDEVLDEEDAEDDVAQDWAELQYMLGLIAIAAGLPRGGGQRAELVP